MPRTRHLTLRCAHGGCRETGSGAYDNQREAAEWRAKPWHCWRHVRPDEVITPERPERTTELVSVQQEHGRFFGPEGGYAGSGMVVGPGFKILADDFPAGSRLIVSVRVVSGDVDLWVDFDDVDPGGYIRVPATLEERRALDFRRIGGVHMGTAVTLGDREGCRRPAVVVGFGPDHVDVRVDMGRFESTPEPGSTPDPKPPFSHLPADPWAEQSDTTVTPTEGAP